MHSRIISEVLDSAGVSKRTKILSQLDACMNETLFSASELSVIENYSSSNESIESDAAHIKFPDINVS